jgi:hypothetical protein
LVHDTYRSEDDAHELLDFCGATQQLVSRDQAAEQIKDHLRPRLARIRLIRASLPPR